MTLGFLNYEDGNGQYEERVPKSIREAAAHIEKAIGFRNLLLPQNKDQLKAVLESITGGRIYSRNSVDMVREAQPSANFQMLTLAGANTVFNNAAKLANTSFEKFAAIVPSTKAFELYDPLWLTQFPDFVDETQPFPEKSVAYEKHVYFNKMWGGIESFSKVLQEDDQTGQIVDRIGRAGGSYAMFKDMWAAAMLMGGNITVTGKYFPASTYKTNAVAGDGVTLTGPWHQALGNMVTAAGPVGVPFTLGNLQAAISLRTKMKDPQGKLLARPNKFKLIVSSLDEMKAYREIMSPLLANAVTATNNFGGIGNTNPISQFNIEVVVNYHLPAWAWILMDDTSNGGFVYQQRSPLELIPETPGSGADFANYSARWRGKERGLFEWRESRFAILGNPGILDTGAALIIDGVTGVAGALA